MKASAVPTSVTEILSMRDAYRAEMRSQIVHDSLHARAGWTQSYLLKLGDVTVGYGSNLIGGPWKGTRTVFEFYLEPRQRPRAFDLFEALLAASDATAILSQTNDSLLTAMLHTYAGPLTSDRIVFQDYVTTAHPSGGATFRKATKADEGRIFEHHREPVGDWVIEFEGTIIATGGVLFHYNRPYGDLFMETAEPFRRRGFGSYLVQELKRACYELGSVPCARCSPTNIPSRRTLQKAGFVPCAHILEGPVKRA